jgi:hypothetical protein
MDDRPVPDVPLKTVARHSVLGGLDHFSGMAGLLLTAMVGLDLYAWLVLHKPPRMAIVWFPSIGANIFRRATLGEDGQWPVSWSRALGVYSVIVLSVVLIKRPTSWDDWVLAGSAVLFAGGWMWKAAHR